MIYSGSAVLRIRIHRIRIISLDPDLYQKLGWIRNSDSYRFCLDPDPYQSSVRIRIRNEFFQILDLDQYQNDTDNIFRFLVSTHFIKAYLDIILKNTLKSIKKKNLTLSAMFYFALQYGTTVQNSQA